MISPLLTGPSLNRPPLLWAPLSEHDGHERRAIAAGHDQCDARRRRPVKQANAEVSSRQHRTIDVGDATLECHFAVRALPVGVARECGL